MQMALLGFDRMKAGTVTKRVGITIILMILPSGVWRREPAHSGTIRVTVRDPQILLARPLGDPDGRLPSAPGRPTPTRGLPRR